MVGYKLETKRFDKKEREHVVSCRNTCWQNLVFFSFHCGWSMPQIVTRGKRRRRSDINKKKKTYKQHKKIMCWTACCKTQQKFDWVSACVYAGKRCPKLAYTHGCTVSLETSPKNAMDCTILCKEMCDITRNDSCKFWFKKVCVCVCPKAIKRDNQYHIQPHAFHFSK